MPSLSQTYPVDHPTAAGHFPGDPLIPGALLLSDAVQAIRRACGNSGTECTVSAAKFPSFVRPGDTVMIDYSEPRADRVDFTCRVDDRTVLSGKLAWSATTPA